MKWTHATGLVSTFALIAAGAVWAGCSGDDNKTDGGGSDSGGNDATSKDSGGGDTGTTDSGGLVVDGSVLDCTYYCTNIMAACTGSNQQYLDQATCMTMCNAIPNDAGAGATSGDSLACHMYHLSVAAQGGATAATHCPHAGPFGYDMCGSQCEDFCQQWFASNCTSNTSADGGYPDENECLTYCNAAPGADAAAGAPGTAQSTPAMLCKEYHLENAIKTGGAGGGAHCGHAGENSAGNTCPN